MIYRKTAQKDIFPNLKSLQLYEKMFLQKRFEILVAEKFQKIESQKDRK